MRAASEARLRGRSSLGARTLAGGAVHQASWTTGVLDRVATAVFGPFEWLDGLVYRLLALRHATRAHAGGQPDAVHFLVGSLDLGGTQRQLISLVRFLEGRGHRCKVWLQHEGGCFTPALEAAGATWECLFPSPESPWCGPWLFRVWRRLRARSHVLTALALAARLRRERPAVLQCLLDTTNVSGALGGRMARVPVVVAGLRSLHPGERSAEVAPRFQQRCYRLLRPALVDAVVANSESGRISFLRGQPDMAAAQVRVVRNGVDPPPSSATDAEVHHRLGLSPEVPTVLWAGRLAPEKRLDVFLRACATLRAGGRRFTALVVGDGPERGRLQDLAAVLGLSEYVRFLGFREDVADIIKASRVAVLTSDVEGLPNILLEAQRGARAVVATRAGGTGEVVADGVTGFLVEVGDDAGLAAGLCRLLDDPSLAAKLGRAGAERSRRLFQTQRMGEETLALYHELARSKGFQIRAPAPPEHVASSSGTADARRSLVAGAVRRAALALADRSQWLDALAYRLLAARTARGVPADADQEAIHFFVGSLGLGGAQRQMVALLRFLVARGFRCKVWVAEPRLFFAADVVEAGARWEWVYEEPGAGWRRKMFLRVCRFFSSASHALPALALAARLRPERPMLLQCLLDTTNVAGALAGRMAGVPVVVAGLLSLHPGERRDVATRFQRRCYRLLRPTLVDAVIANSESGRASFLRRQQEMPVGKVRMVRNGVDPTPPTAPVGEIQRRLDLPTEIPVVLWAGRLAPEKRLDVLLRACADLVARGRSFLTLVVGEGRERAALESLAVDLGLSRRVHFTGVRRDVADILHVARVTVLTSEIEGIPNILLEAQIAGCPVVATRAGGTSELVEDGVTGFLAPIGDHAAIASHLARLLDDPVLAANMGRAGAERSRRLFGATRMGEETLAIYRELAKGRGLTLG